MHEELKAGRVILIPSQKEAEELGIHVHYSPFKVIPKKGKPDKWRLTINLSAPERALV